MINLKETAVTGLNILLGDLEDGEYFRFQTDGALMRRCMDNGMGSILSLAMDELLLSQDPGERRVHPVYVHNVNIEVEYL